MKRTYPLICSLALVAGCTTSGSADSDTGADGTEDSGSDAGDEAGDGDGDGSETGEEQGDGEVPVDMGDDLPDTSALQMMLDQALLQAPAGVDGITLVVHDESDERVLELTAGDMPTDRRMAVASASKYVSALGMLRLIDAGSVSFDDTPGDVLGWTGPLADATFDQLGAFVSGLPGDHLCTLDPLVTLDECAATLDDVEPIGVPGERFRYGSAHMATMGSMAQQLTGTNWDTLFEEEVKGPLGIDSQEVHYYTIPTDEGIGTQNPLLAGGLVISIDEYMPILSVLLHRGEFEGEEYVDPGLMERFFRNDYPDALIDEPVVGPYSFGSWLLCGPGVHECGTVSSPGAFGFTPWVVDEPDEPRYYAVLGMRADGGDGAVFSVVLVGELMPLITEYLEGL